MSSRSQKPANIFACKPGGVHIRRPTGLKRFQKAKTVSNRFREDQVSRRTQYAVPVLYDCEARIADGNTIESASGKPCSSGEPPSSIARSGPDARIAHHGPGNCAQLRGRIYVSSRSQKPANIFACKPGGVHIRRPTGLKRFQKAKTVSNRFREDQVSRRTQYAVPVLYDCEARIADGNTIESASGKPCSSGEPPSSIARSGPDARIAHHGPGNCAQLRGRIYVSSRSQKPANIFACKPGGVHIRRPTGLKRFQKAKTVSNRFREDQVSRRTQYAVPVLYDCEARIADGNTIESASGKPCSSGEPPSSIARSGPDARIAHHGPGNCAQLRGRIYVSSRSQKPANIFACKPGGVHIRRPTGLKRFQKAKTVSNRFREDQVSRRTQYAVPVLYDCEARIADGNTIESASGKPCSSGEPPSSIARSGPDARIAHHGPGNCAQLRGRIYVSSRSQKPANIFACKPGGVHIRIWSRLSPTCRSARHATQTR